MGEPLENIARTFGFLVTDFGFDGPRVVQSAYEIHHYYSTSEVEIDVFSDGTSVPQMVVHPIESDQGLCSWEIGHYQEMSAKDLTYARYLEMLRSFLLDNPEILRGQISRHPPYRETQKRKKWWEIWKW